MNLNKVVSLSSLKTYLTEQENEILKVIDFYFNDLDFLVRTSLKSKKFSEFVF